MVNCARPETRSLSELDRKPIGPWPISKMIRFSCFFLRWFLLSFWSLLGRFWRHFGAHFGHFPLSGAHFVEKVDSSKTLKNQWFFMLLALPGYPEAIKVLPRSVFLTHWFLVSNFNGFWMTFGPLWEPFGTLRELKIRPKSASFSGRDPRRSKSMILGSFWTDFSSILDSFWTDFSSILGWF